jgi:hypothetical protein
LECYWHKLPTLQCIYIAVGQQVLPYLVQADSVVKFKMTPSLDDNQPEAPVDTEARLTPTSGLPLSAQIAFAQVLSDSLPLAREQLQLWIKSQLHSTLEATDIAEVQGMMKGKVTARHEVVCNRCGKQGHKQSHCLEQASTNVDSKASTKKVVLNKLIKTTLKSLPMPVPDDAMHEIELDGVVVAKYCSKCKRFTKGKGLHSTFEHRRKASPTTVCQVDADEQSGATSNALMAVLLRSDSDSDFDSVDPEVQAPTLTTVLPSIDVVSTPTSPPFPKWQCEIPDYDTPIVVRPQASTTTQDLDNASAVSVQYNEAPTPATVLSSQGSNGCIFDDARLLEVSTTALAVESAFDASPLPVWCCVVPDYDTPIIPHKHAATNIAESFGDSVGPTQVVGSGPSALPLCMDHPSLPLAFHLKGLRGHRS